jgi:hypothetical protein
VVAVLVAAAGAAFAAGAVFATDADFAAGFAVDALQAALLALPALEQS